MGRFDKVFTRQAQQKKAEKAAQKLLDMQNKKSAPTGISAPKTLKGKIDYARVMSAKIFADRIERLSLLLDEHEIIKYFAKIKENGIYALDTETNGLDRVDGEIAGICLYTPGEQGAYIPVGHKSYMTHAPLKTNIDAHFIKKRFETISDCKPILHNSKFDMHIMKRMCDVNIVPHWDTLIASFLLNENEPHGLKTLWKKYCSDESEEVGKFTDLFKGIEFNLIPPDVGYMYAAFDPIMTFELYEFQKEFLEIDGKHCREKGLERVAKVFREIEMPLINVVFDMEYEGVLIDTELADTLKQKYQLYLDRALNSFYEELGKIRHKIDKLMVTKPDLYNKLSNPVNIGSPTQLAILLYDVLQLENKEGTRGTGEDILKQLNHPIVASILEHRSMSKLITTYIDAIPSYIKTTKRLHANFNQIGAKTGRFSSSDPNLQNIPSKDKQLSDGTIIDAGHDIRQLFTATPGNVFVGSDYSQQEPRILATLANDKNMIDAYLEGKDLYATIASILYKVAYEDCKEFRPDGTQNPEGKKRRGSVKSILLGIMYGRGSASIAEQMGITTKEAEAIITNFFTEFPGVAEFIQFTQENAREYGFVETLYGSKRRLPDMQLDDIEITPIQTATSANFNPFFDDEDELFDPNFVPDDVYYKYATMMNKAWGRKKKEEVKEQALSEGYKISDNGGKIADAERQCVNSVVQGSAAFMTKTAMIRIHNDAELQRLGFRLRMCVHDEVIGECPEMYAKDAAKRLTEVMVEVANEVLKTGMKCDAEVTYRWYGEEIEI